MTDEEKKALLSQYLPFQKDLDFIDSYCNAINAATGSDVDPNSNVRTKNVSTLESEIHKKDNVFANRLRMFQTIRDMYGEELAYEYLRQLNDHEIYRHDETGVVGKPYCAAISLMPFLVNGLTTLGGQSEAPTNLESYCGGYINLVFAVSALILGACATPEFLVAFDHFARKDLGEDYYLRPDDVVFSSPSRQRTIDQYICDKFQQVIYSLNQPAGSRTYQSPFVNFSYFDKGYFDALFNGYWFPDGDQPKWESLRWLQKRFMKWFNAERSRKILTFPVETFSILNDGENFPDQDSADWIAQMYAEGHSFFTYTSKHADALSSCCRLRNAIDLEENVFSYSLGAGSIQTGSKCVITMNLNRLVQNAVRDGRDIGEAVREQTEKIHKYLFAFDKILMDMTAHHMIPIYDEPAMIDPDKLYLTTGISGLNEAAEFMGIEPSDNEAYRDFVQMILKPIYEQNKADRSRTHRLNTELVPGENLGAKLRNWDAEDGYVVPDRPAYNSYIFRSDDPTIDPMQKFRMHGDAYTEWLDGGSANHVNLDEHLSKEQYAFLLRYAAKHGTGLFTYNVPNTVCRDCGHISKHYLKKCPKCGSENLDYASRVIGYLTLISAWSMKRQEEAKRRYYAKPELVEKE